MKSVAFADGEELTEVRGQRNWISFLASAAIASSIPKRCSRAPETGGITSPLNTRANVKLN